MQETITLKTYGQPLTAATAMPRDSLFEIRQPPIPITETGRGIRSLREICVKTLATHFDLIECAGPLDSGLFTEIVCHPSCQATPQSVLRLEEQHPHLSSSDSDDCYWRKRKKCVMAARKSGVAPLPVLCKRVSHHQAELERWIGEKSEVPERGAQKAVASRLGTTPLKTGKSTVSEQSVLQAVKSLAGIPMPVALLLETKVGKTLSRVVKACRKTNDAVFSSANDLLMRWKRDAQENSDFIISNLGQCETWKQLYILLTKAEDQKKENFAIRAREIAAETAQAKRSTYRLTSVQIPPLKRQRRQDPQPTLSYSNVSRRVDSSSNSVSPPPATPHKSGFRLNASTARHSGQGATRHVPKNSPPRSTAR